MAGFLDNVGQWFGNMSGINQAGTASQQNQAGQGNQAAGAGVMGSAAQTAGQIASVNPADFARQSAAAGQALGGQMGAQAADIGTQKAMQAGRTAGLNKGQAAITGGATAGQNFAQGQQAGQGLGMQAYGQGAQNQLGAAGVQGNIGANQGDLGTNQMQGGLNQSAQGNQAGGSLLSAVGGLFSDEKVKEDIKESPKVEEVAERVEPVGFKYNNEMEQGAGEHMGVTAQDMEKTPLKENVINTPMGKMIHPGKQENSNLNMIVQLSKKVDEILKKKGMR